MENNAAVAAITRLEQDRTRARIVADLEAWRDELCPKQEWPIEQIVAAKRATWNLAILIAKGHFDPKKHAKLLADGLAAAATEREIDESERE